MRAAVLVGPNRIEVRRVPRPEPAAHEVRVAVRAVGLCGTDLHIYAGHANYHRDARGEVIPLDVEPQVLGHEIAGEVEAVGAGVVDLRAGDRVVVDQGRTCVGEGRTPRCEYCATGDSHQCEFYREHGITGPPGGLADALVVPARNAVPLGRDLPWEQAALVEPLGCVIHSCDVLLRAPARYSLDAADPERRVRAALVVGAGPSGLLFVQYLREVLGYRGLLLVSEPNARRRALAERFGADAIDPNAQDLGLEVQRRTAGRRVELVVESAGSGSAVAAMPSLLRKQGTLLLYGHGHSGTDLGVLNGVQFLEPTLVSPVGASGGFEPDGRPSTYVRALRLIEQRRIDVGALITHRFHSLDEVPRAFAGGHRGPEYVKGVVVL